MTDAAKLAEQEIAIANAYRRLFMDGDGNFTPDGEAVMRDLERECGWMKTKLPTIQGGGVDPLRLAADTQARHIYAHVKVRLQGDLTQLRKLTEKIT
jgi:hypothetical protein